MLTKKNKSFQKKKKLKVSESETKILAEMEIKQSDNIINRQKGILILITVL